MLTTLLSLRSCQCSLCSWCAQQETHDSEGNVCVQHHTAAVTTDQGQETVTATGACSPLPSRLQLACYQPGLLLLISSTNSFTSFFGFLCGHFFSSFQFFKKLRNRNINTIYYYCMMYYCGSVVESICCSSRAPALGSSHPHGSSQP